MCSYFDHIKFNYLINKFIYRINSEKISFFNKKSISILLKIYSIYTRNHLKIIKIFFEKKYLTYAQCLKVEKSLFFFAFFNYKKKLRINYTRNDLKKIDTYVYKKNLLEFNIKNSIESIKNQLKISETMFFFLKTSMGFFEKIQKLNNSFLKENYNKKRITRKFFFINLLDMNTKTFMLIIVNIVTVCSLIVCLILVKET
ncbi:hypothetical protein CPARA_2gp295 (nucleomorph) [Cryptomonas paramecium]|uniref:Transmembrane protein n=1 Tax=Cryptomonas paramaecium TaxID=2898 RepID=F2HI07_9CRYP|nr:hypothetical protein CPARA_2gp295 [Cryptomonas paramecium]AEA38953.1 hypothetical protein CPARA_2gp295 [Cryptomonas paramecium]